LNIGYQSSGTCLDYVYEKLNVPYAFAFEIYTDETKLPELEKLKTKGLKNLNQKMKNNQSHFIETVEKLRPTNFLELSNKFNFKNKLKRSYSNYENKVCLSLFNPLDKVSLNYIKENWTNILKYLFESIIDK